MSFKKNKIHVFDNIASSNKSKLNHASVDDLTESSQENLEKEANRISFGYIAATVILALSILISYFLMSSALSTEENYLSLIFTASKQQGLYQVTYERTKNIKDSSLVEENPRLLYQIRRKLRDEMIELKNNQNTMKKLIEELNDPKLINNFKSIYYSEPYYLDKRQREYFFRVNEILDSDVNVKVLRTEYNVWTPIDAISGAQGVLTLGYQAVLDEAGNQFVLHAKKLRTTQRWITGILILFLVFEVLFIFKPLVESLKRTHKQVLDTQLAIQKTQKMEAMGRVATGLAHEFNNFLVSIIGNAEIALSNLRLGRHALEPLQSIIRSSKSSALLSKRLLTLSKIDEPKRINVNWNDVIHDNEELLRQICGPKIKLIFNCSSDLWHVYIDTTEAVQVILNLVVNAKDAIKTNDGIIKINTMNITEVSGDQVVLEIQDNGIGIKEELREKIFEHFFTTKPVDQGTGLGLPNISTIVKQCGGEISVESKLGEGAQFKIILPRSLKFSEDERNLAQESYIDNKGSKRSPILIVDDDESVAMVTKQLVTAFGYQVESVTSANHALELLKDKTFSLVITDVNMPGTDGIKLSEEIYKNWSDIPVIFCSGLSVEKSIQVQRKGRYFLSKPYDLDELKQVLFKAFSTHKK